MSIAKPLAVGSLANVLLAGGWHGAEVVEVSSDGKLYAVKLLEASDPCKVGQQLGGFFTESADYFYEPAPANIKPAQVFIMRSVRAEGGSWWSTGDACSVSHGRDSLAAAVGSMLESWESEGRRERGEFPELVEAAVALLTAGTYRSADGLVQYWFKF